MLWSCSSRYFILLIKPKYYNQNIDWKQSTNIYLNLNMINVQINVLSDKDFLCDKLESVVNSIVAEIAMCQMISS